MLIALCLLYYNCFIIVSDVNGVSSQDGLFRYPSFDSPENAAMSAALIAAASFGIIILFSVLVLLGKRLFDSWQRRDYSRMDYLINGMYN